MAQITELTHQFPKPLKLKDVSGGQHVITRNLNLNRIIVVKFDKKAIWLDTTLDVSEDDYEIEVDIIKTLQIRFTKWE